MTEEYVRKSDVVKVLTNNGVHFNDMVKITSEIRALDTFEFDDQGSVLDEIKAEIEKLDGMYVLRDHVFYAEKSPKDAWFWYVRLKEVIDIIDIIDKYKESEE